MEGVGLNFIDNEKKNISVQASDKERKEEKRRRKPT